MNAKKRVMLVVALMTATGCANPDDEAVGPASDAVVESLPLGAAHLQHDDSAVKPYCGAAQVGPSLAVTARYCVEHSHPDALSVHVVTPRGDSSSRIASVRWEEELAWLELETPIDNALPELISDAPDCLTVATYDYAIDGGAVHTDAWHGCIDRSVGDGWILHIDDGDPSCHGDGGAGAYDPETGALVGISVGGDYSGPERSPAACFSGFHVVSL